MIDAGMNVARLNFSHGDHKSHGAQAATLQAALKQRPDKSVALMLDTKGPEIRTGALKEGKNINLSIGQALEITTDYTIEGDNTKISCSYKNLPNSVKVGSTIFIADGSLTCVVTEIREVSNPLALLKREKIFYYKISLLPFCLHLLIRTMNLGLSYGKGHERCQHWRKKKYEPSRMSCRSPHSL